MIYGRPTNLWLGLITALAGFVSVTLVAAGIDPTIVANLVGAGAGVLGALIMLVANAPATINQGDTVNVITPKGEPNKTVEVN
jgi:hypothetical protein